MKQGNETNGKNNDRTNISYDVNLSFDMRTTNNNSVARMPQGSSQINNSVSPTNRTVSKRATVVCDESSGKSSDNRHSSNPDTADGNFRPVGLGCGKPHGNCHDSNAVAGL